jgi:protein-tyrosine phosphatase
VIDLHSHILAGIDDGPGSLAESIEIAQSAVADGITAIAATPHVRDDWPTEPELMEVRVEELRAELERAGIELDIRTGAEIAIEWLSRLTDEELRRFGLGGNPRYLLVETPYRGWPLALTPAVLQLRERGVTPVLAHPERNGVLVQVTAASVDGRIGRRAQQCGLLLIEKGFAHMLASDAHHASVRAVGMAEAAEVLGGGALARWLTTDVPGAILRDDPIPPRPAQVRSRGLLARLFRS